MKGNNMREDYDDDLEDDELEDEDDDGILRDGESMKVPIHMLDSVQRSIAEGYDPVNNRPGWRVPERVRELDHLVDHAHRDYVRFLRDAHKRPDAPKPKPVSRPLTLDAARAAAEQARIERDAWLVNAYKERRKRKPGVQLPHGWAFGDQPAEQAREERDQWLRDAHKERRP
jgi:hypothetical protein